MLKSDHLPRSSVIFFLFTLCLFPVFGLGSQDLHDLPRAVNGVLDLRDWDFENKGVLKLEGEWLFLWEEQLTSDAGAFSKAVSRAHPITVPGYWNNLSIDGKKLPDSGYATYLLKILLPESEERFAINFRNVQTSYTFYANGTLLARTGSPGKTRETTVPSYHSKVSSFSPHVGSVEIILHVSNFHHREAGLWDAVRFGLESQVWDQRSHRQMLDIFLASGILTIAIYHLFIFFYRRKDKSNLYFALFSLVVAARTILTSELIIFHFFPGISWELVLTLEYITFYVLSPLFLLYLHSLFPRGFISFFRRVPILIALLFSLLATFTPTALFSRTMEAYQIITVIEGGYAVFILSRAAVQRKPNSRLLLGGFFFLFIITINDILYANQVLATGLFISLGMMLFLVSQALMLARRSGMLFSKIELQTAELKKTNLILNTEVDERRKLEGDLIESYKQVAQSRQGIILGLAKLAEHRDEDTGAHLERIREYCKVLALELTEHPDYKGYITGDYIEDLYQSAILHDIGKVGVPDHILLKPAKLTEDEFSIIKRHPKIGGDAIRNVEKTMKNQSFLTLGKEIAYSHHEKWDGTGYPYGLAEKAIPLSARLVALADVYDALSSERPYKKSFTEEETVEIILKGRGTHFDPDIVDCFLRCRNKFLEIRVSLLENEA